MSHMIDINALTRRQRELKSMLTLGGSEHVIAKCTDELNKINNEITRYNIMVRTQGDNMYNPQYPQNQGMHPHQNQQYQNPQQQPGYYDQQAQYAPPPNNGYVPPQHSNYPVQNGHYPPPNAQYPTQNGYYPPPQENAFSTAELERRNYEMRMRHRSQSGNPAYGGQDFNRSTQPPTFANASYSNTGMGKPLEKSLKYEQRKSLKSQIDTAINEVNREVDTYVQSTYNEVKEESHDDELTTEERIKKYNLRPEIGCEFKFMIRPGDSLVPLFNATTYKYHLKKGSKKMESKEIIMLDDGYEIITPAKLLDTPNNNIRSLLLDNLILEGSAKTITSKVVLVHTVPVLKDSPRVVPPVDTTTSDEAIEDTDGAKDTYTQTIIDKAFNGEGIDLLPKNMTHLKLLKNYAGAYEYIVKDVLTTYVNDCFTKIVGEAITVVDIVEYHDGLMKAIIDSDVLDGDVKNNILENLDNLLLNLKNVPIDPSDVETYNNIEELTYGINHTVIYTVDKEVIETLPTSGTVSVTKGNNKDFYTYLKDAKCDEGIAILMTDTAVYDVYYNIYRDYYTITPKSGYDKE